MTNPKIKVSVDMASARQEVEKEINALKSKLNQLGDQLKSASGKADFNLNGSKSELNALIATADKLTAALDKGDKKSAQYAKTLKTVQDTLANAAKIAAKLETAGGVKGGKVSGYFNTYASEIGQERDYVARTVQQERERKERFTRMERGRHDAQVLWANRAARFAGFIGGMAAGGGGSYSTLGAGIGSMLPGPARMFGGAVGGMLGGIADHYVTPAREEAKTISELRRAVGATTHDFELLRDSVRSAVRGLGIADDEAANLAKHFARTAVLSDSSEGYIANSLKTSGGLAQGYGIGAEQTTSFFASMRLNGAARNDADNRRLAMMIAESVQRGGTSAKMDEVLGAISSYVAHQAQQTLTAPNTGQYASYLASLTGSNYAGLHHHTGNAAALIMRADEIVRGGGTMGEASQLHWLLARQRAFPGMSAMDNGIMQSAGLTGDLASQFATGSPVYDRANAAARAQMDRTRQSILASGYRNNFEAGLAHIKAISSGNSYLENANFRGMFGGTPQQAAALMKMLEKDPGLGSFEKKLAGYGIGIKNLNVSQLSSLSELIGGGTPAMVKQYEKLAGSGKLRKEELDRMNKIMLSEGYGQHFKKELLGLTAKYDVDDGLKAQTTQIDIQNKIQEGVSNLVHIETDMREYLLRLLDRFGAAGPIFNRMAMDLNGSELSGKNMKGGEWNRSGSKFLGLGSMSEVSSRLAEISMAGGDEKQHLYDSLVRDAQRNPEDWPAEIMAMAKKAKGVTELTRKFYASLTDNNELPSISGVVAPFSGGIAQKIIAEARRQEIPPEIALGLAQKESAMGASMFGPMIRKGMHAGDRAYGPYQYMAKSAAGWDRFNLDENIAHGVADLKRNHERFGDWNLAIAAHHTGPNRPEYLRGEIPYLSDGYSTTRDYVNDVRNYADRFKDEMPEKQRKTSLGPRRDLLSFNHAITLYDPRGNQLADPLTVTTSMGAPIPAGS